MQQQQRLNPKVIGVGYSLHFTFFKEIQSPEKLKREEFVNQNIKSFDLHFYKLQALHQQSMQKIA